MNNMNSYNSFNYSVNSFIYLAILMIGLSELDFIFSELRYLKYLILPISFFIMFASVSWRENLRDNVINLYVILLLWAFVSGVLNLTLDAFGLKDLFFISVYVFSLLAFVNDKYSVKKLFLIYSTLTVSSFFFEESNSFSLLESTAPFESSSCFAFSAFLIYFLIVRDFKLALISLVLVFLTLKRVVLPAIIIAFIYVHFKHLIGRFLVSKLILYFIAFIMPVISVMLTLGVFDYLIETLTGRNASWITLGRTSHYLGVVEAMVNEPYKIIFGNGIGSTYILSAAFYNPDEFQIGNLHSDLLKIFFELGAIFYIMFFYYLIRNSTAESRLFLYLILFLYTTDNSLVYSGVSFVIIALMVKVKNDYKYNLSKS